jgi:ubiquitin C-terminal hydrolase
MSLGFPSLPRRAHRFLFSPLSVFRFLNLYFHSLDTQMYGSRPSYEYLTRSSSNTPTTTRRVVGHSSTGQTFGGGSTPTTVVRGSSQAPGTRSATSGYSTTSTDYGRGDSFAYGGRSPYISSQQAQESQRLQQEREQRERERELREQREREQREREERIRNDRYDPFAYGGRQSSTTSLGQVGSRPTSATLEPRPLPVAPPPRVPTPTTTSSYSYPYEDDRVDYPPTPPILKVPRSTEGSDRERFHTSSAPALPLSQTGSSINANPLASQQTRTATQTMSLLPSTSKQSSTLQSSTGTSTSLSSGQRAPLKGPTSNPISSSSSSSSRSLLPKPFGFRNLGNTCYLNATLQCVVHTPGFIDSLRTQSSGRRVDLVKTLIELMSEPQSVGPLLAGVKQKTSLLNSEFVGFGQNDGHEFLRALLHAVHNEVNRSAGAKYRQLVDIDGERDEDAARRWAEYHLEHDDSVVYDLFGSQLQHTTQCSKCGYRSLSFDPALDLSLPLPKGSMFSTPSTDVLTLLQNFTAPEELKGTDQFICPKCKKGRDATRTTLIRKWPSVLVLHLKRFSSSGSKNSAKVAYLSELTISKEVQCTARAGFILRGVVIHHGSASYGHYTSYVRSPTDERWYYCDDSSVREVSEAEALEEKAGAYFLFYQRR